MCLSGLFRPLIQKLRRTDDAGEATHKGSEASKEQLPSDEFGELVLHDGCDGGSGVDIVFVHGLRGSRIATWLQDDVCWPRDLIKDDVKNGRIITWGYDARIASVFQYASKESIFGHANALLEDLARIREDKERPIVFVCHSLGGLVVKEALIKAANYHSHERHSRLAAIYTATRGIIFLGTPHRGSSKESLGSIVEKAAKYAFRQPNSQLLESLRPDAHILERQRDDFTTISANNFSTVCYREEKPTAIGMIVPETSATYEGFNVRTSSINANHMDMAKFRSKGDTGYKRVLGHIQELIQEAQQPRLVQATLLAGMSMGLRDSNDECRDAAIINNTGRKKILDLLCELFFRVAALHQSGQLANRAIEREAIQAQAKDILEALMCDTIEDQGHQVGEAHAETCSWAFKPLSTIETGAEKRPSFLPWLQGDETFLWISGKAGCGKSTLMRYLYGHAETRASLEKWAKSRDLIVTGHFFFERGGDLNKSREGMLRSILYHVLKDREYLIPKVFDKMVLNKSKTSPSWDVLCNAFKSTLDHLQEARVCIFLDGLDEYRMLDKKDDYTEDHLELISEGDKEDAAWGLSPWITGGHQEIATFLVQFLNYPHVKVCLSSRELPTFERAFAEFPRLQVHLHTEPSISSYCEERLSKETPALPDLSEFASAITQKSQGVFLWVRLVVDLLVTGHTDGNSKEELLETLEDLPDRLGGKKGLYMRMIKGINPKYLAEAKRLFEVVLGWRDVTRDLPLDIILIFLIQEGHLRSGGQNGLRVSHDRFELKTWGEQQPQWSHLQNRLKSRCGGLLEGTHNVQFMHQTAKEFVLKGYVWNDIFGPYEGFVTMLDRHLATLSGLIRRLKCCWEALPRPDLSVEKLADMTPGELESVWSRSQFSLRGYGLVHSAFNVAQSADTEMGDTPPHDYINLIDELNLTGRLLMSEWRKRFPSSLGRLNTTDRFWGELWMAIEPDDNTIGIFRTRSRQWLIPNFEFRDMLDLALHKRLLKYVGVKLLNQEPSKIQLQHLLARSTRVLHGSYVPHKSDPDSVGWEQTRAFSWIDEDCRSFVEMLLMKGADPNSIDPLADYPTALERGWTIWAGLIGDSTDDNIDGWASVVELFLEHGADPSAQWRIVREEDEVRMTPSTVVKAMLEDEYFEDTRDALERILRRLRGMESSPSGTET